jgi:hypothetical protein
MTLHSMAQAGPLRECQDIMGPPSACLVIIWSPSGGSFRLPVILICIAKCLPCGGLLQCRWYFIPAFRHTFSEKKFFLTSRRGARIRRFSGSAAALVTLSISLAILNLVSLCHFCSGTMSRRYPGWLAGCEQP